MEDKAERRKVALFAIAALFAAAQGRGPVMKEAEARGIDITLMGD